MMTQYRPVLILAGLMLLLQACGSTKPSYENDVQTNFQQGVEFYEDEKYFKAAEFFTYVVFNSPGSEIADDAQLYLGNCHFGLKEYIIAVDEYQRLISRWPASELVEEARYKMAMSYYELSPRAELYQNYTEDAIRAFQNFVQLYPASEYRSEAEKSIAELRLKLAEKLFQSGELYMVFREWKAALITFEQLEAEYFDTEIIDRTYLKMAQCHNELQDPAKTAYYLEQVRVDRLKNAREKAVYSSLSRGD